MVTKSQRTKQQRRRRTKASASQFWIATVIGLAVLLSGCFGGNSAEAFVASVAPTPEPVYEPRGEEGNNTFFSVDEQIAATNSGIIDLALAEAAAAGIDPQSAILNVSLTSPSEDEIKSGLYGGSLENTCDPERLITHLLDNPTQGQVWADVQGIEFSELPTFIRSLTPEVLEADLTVLNHGFDPKGHAIPIVSTLAEGTAVLVDADGNVRTKCYCGNPILPYEPTEYEPPQCLTFYAIVYSSPSDRKIIEDAPRSVRATNQIGSYDNVEWKEVTWGNTKGWVRADESETRYCKPVDKIDCVNFAQVTQRPGSDDYIGEFNDSYVSVVAANLEGWALVKFAETSGWVPADAMNGADCTYEVQCISSNSGTWSRPAFAGREFVNPGQAQRVEFSGQTFIDGTGTYRQVYVTSPSPTRVGYVLDSDVTVRDSDDCQIGTYCSLFDVDINVYQESEGSATWGVLWFAEVSLVTAEPTNGRYLINWGNGSGWVDIGDLHGEVSGYPCQTVECIQAYAPAFEPNPDQAGTRALPSGPIVATFTGHVAKVDGTTYREFSSPSVAGGKAWLEASVGYYPRDWSACEVEPPCLEEFQYCQIRCIANYENEQWTVQAVWDPSNITLEVNFDWPAPLVGQSIVGRQQTGITDFAFGSPALPAPITVTGTHPETGVTDTANCEVNLCHFNYDGDIGYLGELERPDPESCIRVTCSTSLRAGNGGFARDVTVSWTPATTPPTQLSYINWDFPAGYSDGSRNDRISPQTFSQPPGPNGIVDVTWIGPDGQSGIVSCVIGCDVFDIEFPTAETADCCPDRTTFVQSSSECCPSEKVTDTGCGPDCPTFRTLSTGECCEDGTRSAGQECIPDCAEVRTLSNGECCEDGTRSAGQECIPECPEVRTLSNGECCEDGTRSAGQECIPDCDGVVASSGQCCPDGVTGDGECVRIDEPTVTPVPEETPTVTPVPDTPTVTPVPDTPTVTPVPGCPDGTAPNGECFRVCAPGELNLDGLCICTDGFQLDGVNGCIIDCPPGEVAVSSAECVPETCPAGQERVGSQCQTIACPAGQERVDGQCQDVVVVVDCPAGYETFGTDCLSPRGCLAPDVELWNAGSELPPAGIFETCGSPTGWTPDAIRYWPNPDGGCIWGGSPPEGVLCA